MIMNRVFAIGVACIMCGTFTETDAGRFRHRSKVSIFQRHKARTCNPCVRRQCAPQPKQCVGQCTDTDTAKIEGTETKVNQSYDLSDSEIRIAESILKYVNAERERRNLNVLVMHPGLTNFAFRHSMRMRANHRMFHSRGAYRENVAFGFGSSQATVRAWMRSRGHRATILVPSAQYFGGFGYGGSGWTMVVR